MEQADLFRHQQALQRRLQLVSQPEMLLKCCAH